MTDMLLRKQILHQIDQLNPDQQRRVLDFMRHLDGARPHGVDGRTLLKFAGSIEADDLREMTAAIEEGCERVEADAWSSPPAS